MAKKTVNFNRKGINDLPKDKPVLYKIMTEKGNVNYAGIAQRGQAQNRVTDHLGKIPGAKIRVEQFSNIADARKKEADVIKRTQPKYNKQGK